ncbi:MAG TPA: transglutaminase domain-containing protein [Candidatus Acidoferrales bacterium]|nr:transglutaminase domain-containing protein [Candidatus Acidoferrales bacterium]
MKLRTVGAVVTALITLPVLGIALSAGSAGRSGPVPATDAQPPARKFSFSYTVRVPATPEAKEKLRLWIPVPQSDAFQDITALEVTAPVKHSLKRDSFYHNEFAYFDVPAAELQKGFEVRMTFDAVRREHRVALDAPRSTGSVPLSPAERKRDLEGDRLVPLVGVIGETAAEQTKGITDPVSKARALYDYVIFAMKYDKTGEGWGRGDAAYFCTAKKGNCTDFHGFFIGMARAAGIPARFAIGFPLPAKATEGAIGGYHCWAEFYVKGYGWIPVDASEAWKNPDKREYFFGAHDVNRVEFTRGRDIDLAPKQGGPPLNYSVYPYGEMGGKVFEGMKTEFGFKDLGGKE